MIEALAANTIKAGVETLAVEAAKEISGQAALEKMQILNQPENFRIGEVLNPEICNKSELKAEENNAIESIQNKLSLFEKNVPKMEDVQQVKTNYENPNNEVEKVKNNPITNLTPSETSKEFIENSVKIEYDDNNTPYRIGDELIPNTDYEINEKNITLVKNINDLTRYCDELNKTIIYIEEADSSSFLMKVDNELLVYIMKRDEYSRSVIEDKIHTHLRNLES